jgi:methyl-accepting chemotaxis protein
MDQTTVPAAQSGDPAAPEDSRATRRRVRNYLIDANMQLKLASYLVLAAAVITAAMAVLLWRAYRETSAVIALADPLIGQVLAQEDRRRMVWLAVGFAVIAVVLLSLALVVTHRVAGPALYLARACRNVREGQLTPLRSLRRRDLLVPLAEEVSLMIEALREREEVERAAVVEAIARLRRPGASPAELECAEILDRLAAEKARRTDA